MRSASFKNTTSVEIPLTEYRQGKKGFKKLVEDLELSGILTNPYVYDITQINDFYHLIPNICYLVVHNDSVLYITQVYEVC
jgi:hypothetical protein